ncbi:SPFH domain / Band 7 family [Popillia japonica]|uniref:Prohibitin n=1 Tax=Popillia japonica TaxID=7064 RepID=A0AAW1L472_POPJA
MDFIYKIVSYFVTPRCYDEYFVKFNFFDVDCFKFTLSKGLGFGIILVGNRHLSKFRNHLLILVLVHRFFPIGIILIEIVLPINEQFGGVVNSALYNVDGGHRAVIFDRFSGVKKSVEGEGTHFFIPWVQRPIIFDVRSRPRNVPVMTGSKDLQNVNITLRILFRPMPDQLPKIYTILGQDYEERVLPSITTEVLKAVVAQFDAGELITQRDLVSQRVSNDLTERAAQFGVILDDISITHLTFGKEFTQAVELKQVAQQDAEKARFLVEKAEQTRKATVISAEGDAQAAILLAKAFGDSGEGLVELRRIEAAEDIAYQLSRSRQVSYLPSGQNLLLNVPTTPN